MTEQERLFREIEELRIEFQTLHTRFVTAYEEALIATTDFAERTKRATRNKNASNGDSRDTSEQGRVTMKR